MADSKSASKRRDGTGHLSLEHERKLRELSQSMRDSNLAFIERFRTRDTLAEELGEAFLQSATSGEESEPERREQVLPEEEGGPFVFTRGSREFAHGYDESNIADATREPLPKTSVADP